MNEPAPPLSWKDISGAPAHGTVLANIDEIPDGGAHLITLNSGTPPFKLILLRTGDKVLAYVNRCAHFGIPLASKPEHLYPNPNLTIQCSVHGARYRWHDGICDAGECVGEALLAIPVRIEGRTVMICDDN